MLETEKSNWSVFVERKFKFSTRSLQIENSLADEKSCKIQIHDRVDVNAEKSHKLEPEQNGNNRLTIDEEGNFSKIVSIFIIFFSMVKKSKLQTGQEHQNFH